MGKLHESVVLPLGPGPLKADYGEGCFRRHLRLDNSADGVIDAQLEDDYHAFAIRLNYDETQVTDITAEWHRHPTSTCPGSALALKEFIGLPLSSNNLAPRRQLKQRLHCTHLYDIASIMQAYAYWTLHDASLPRSSTLLAVEIKDSLSPLRTATLKQDGSTVLEWQLDGAQITAPEPYTGQHAIFGLTDWGRKNLDDVELMHCSLLRMGCFVSMARYYDMQSMVGNPSLESGNTQDSCFAMQGERAQQSVRVGLTVDHSEHPERMLQFAQAKLS